MKRIDFAGVSYIKLEELLFEGSQFLRTAINISGGAHHITVHGCTFRGLGHKEFSSWDANSMIGVYRATDCDIVNNLFDDNFGDGVSLNNRSQRCVVAYNTFTNFKGKNRSEGATCWSRTLDIQDSSDGQHLIAFNQTSASANAILPPSSIPSSSCCYDLQGRRYDSRPTRPGVYIVNGKKIKI